MLAASGVNFGFRRTIPHFSGVYFGFLFMLTIACFGLGEIFTTFPILQPILKYAGSAYLLYLAYRISQSSTISDANVPKPLNFFQAALFQYINPKAWIVAGTIPVAFTQGTGITNEDIMYLVGGHAFVSFPAVMAWVIAGTQVRRLLSTPRSLRRFNITMGLLLAGTVVLILTS